MPLPLILGGAAAAAAAAGVGSAIHGGVKMKKAHDTMKSAEQRHQDNIARFEAQNKQTTEAMDALGKKELEILESFQKFSDIFDRIQNRPEFQEYSKDDVKIPMYNAEELKEVSVGAGVLLGGLGGAALGTAGGFGRCWCDNSRRYGVWDSLYRNGHCLIERRCGQPMPRWLLWAAERLRPAAEGSHLVRRFSARRRWAWDFWLVGSSSI